MLRKLALALLFVTLGSVAAFAADITRRIRVEPVRARIENFMAAQHGLPLDLRITDLGGHDEGVVNA